MRRLTLWGLCVLAVSMVGAGLASAASASSYDLFDWGQNAAGQLGNGTTTQTDSPMLVSGLSGITSVSGANSHALALLAGGTLMTWGSNEFGELGNGTTEHSYVPIAVSGLEDVVEVSTGAHYSVALLGNGTVMAWGENEWGQLGDGTSEESHVPVQVKELSDVKAISAGATYVLALLNDGTVMAWGNDEQGQLGDGTTVNTELPVPVKGLSGVTAISAGTTHSLAIVGGGAVWAWGGNEHGELGDHTTKSSDVPVAVSALSSEVTAISAGQYYSLALRANGTVWAWGGNSFGQLGDGKSGEVFKTDTPGEVVELGGPATAISAGISTSMALLASGHVAVWGGNEHGELGVGMEGKGSLDPLPGDVPGLCGMSGVSEGALYSFAYGEATTPCPSVTGVTPKSGLETSETPVTITGSELSEVTAVKFGSANAISFTVSSATSIRAVAPPGKGTVHVTVITPTAASTTSLADYYTYSSPPPPPAVTGVSPNKGTASGGTTVTITGTNLMEATAVYFGSAETKELHVVSATEMTAVTPPGTRGKQYVTVETTHGTSLETRVAFFKYTKAKKVKKPKK